MFSIFFAVIFSAQAQNKGDDLTFITSFMELAETSSTVEFSNLIEEHIMRVSREILLESKIKNPNTILNEEYRQKVEKTSRTIANQINQAS